MTMKTFDCQLDHHPLVRLQAESPEAAKAEYFRLYAINTSTADWHCTEAVVGSAAPLEPMTWRKRRRELGTLDVAGIAALAADEAKEKAEKEAAEKAAQASTTQAEAPAASASTKPTKAKETAAAT